MWMCWYSKCSQCTTRLTGWCAACDQLTSWSVKQITAVALYLLVSRDAFVVLALLSIGFALLLRGTVVRDWLVHTVVQAVSCISLLFAPCPPAALTHIRLITIDGWLLAVCRLAQIQYMLVLG